MAAWRLFRRSSADFLLQGFESASPWRFRVTRKCHSASQTGLYGFAPLKAAGGFKLFVDDAIERSNELITYIQSQPSPTEIINAMDEISNTVCCVVDSAELCRHTHPDREFVHEANKASVRMNEYLHYLNTNSSLYNAVKEAEMSGHLMTNEARRAATNLRMDFEKGGIHLSNEKLDRVNKLNVEISSLCREFGENIIMDPGHVDVFPATLIPKHLHHLCKPTHKSRTGMPTGLSISRNIAKERGLRIPTDATTLSSILQWTTDEEVRKKAYINGNSTPFANIDVLGKLIATRHELARIIGYRSYSDFMVRQNMASSSGVVKSFLLEMSEMVRDKANQEFNAIKIFKRERNGHSSADLEPWDEAYFTAMMKSSMLNLDSSVVASYFPLASCIKGLKLLVESLFGASFQSIPLSPGESWHPDVIKMCLHHPHEGDLGFLYLDLYAREGKYPGCAHFAVKGGRRISNNEYQLPVVALVCNFSGSPNSSSARLNQWEVETLFHEFGHALHSLLSRTDYQHFSGTRVVLDLAETPSNLFEYYANDYRVLRMFTKHYSTGETIPEKLVEAMQNARKMFAATELQRQIFYAMVDQMLFGDQAPLQRDTSSTVADIKQKFTCWKHVNGTHWQARFSHLLNYGAGYYSYLYAKCLSSTIWRKVCQDDPLSLATGDALRTKFLQHGGAKEPSEMLNDLVGGGILRDHGEGIVPDITCLAEEMELAMGVEQMEGLSNLVRKQRA